MPNRKKVVKKDKSVQAYVTGETKQAVCGMVGGEYSSESEVAAHLLEMGLRERGVPILGSIPAGEPASLGESHIEGYLNPGSALRFNPATDFFLRIKGHSMTNAHRRGGDLRDGEFVLLRRGDGWTHGDVVAALIDDGTATLKRLCYDIGDDLVRLEPFNSEQRVIEVAPDKVEVLAVCKGKAAKADGVWTFSPRCG